MESKNWSIRRSNKNKQGLFGGLKENVINAWKQNSELYLKTKYCSLNYPKAKGKRINQYDWYQYW